MPLLPLLLLLAQIGWTELYTTHSNVYDCASHWFCRDITCCGIFERQHFINDDCLYIAKLTVSHEWKSEDKTQNVNNGNIRIE